MNLSKPHIAALLGLSLVLCGCPGDVAQQVQQVQQQTQAAADWERDFPRLKTLGMAYQRHIDSAGKGPANWQELKQTGGNDPALASLEADGCVVVWGKSFRDASQGTAEYVIAYLPSAEEKGGAVVKLDGSVANMTAGELAEKMAAQGLAP
ncbi:MAG: hypothetical protein HYS13_24235 [Planctomycetia bacterium]|nr:hypothetical protein [Planctomycetia bacterium]